MNQPLIPEDIRKDIEAGVAAALNESDLRAALVAAGGYSPPDDVDDVEIILMLVPRTHGTKWAPVWQGESDTFGPYRDGYVLQTIHALDIAADQSPRTLSDVQQQTLATWQAQTLHENRPKPD